MFTRRAALVLLLACAGCGSALSRAAAHDALPAFRASVSEALRHRVGRGEARLVALSRARYEIDAATGEPGSREIAELSRCAPQLKGALLRRASRPDDTAASAALVAIEAGLVPPLAYANQVVSDSPAWRAVGARSLALPEKSPPPRCEAGWTRCGSADDTRRARAGWWRRHLMLDPYPAVRRAALLAAADAADPNDVGAVLDAARRDPDPEARAAAIRAAGAIGTESAVLGLADDWPAAGEQERRAIVSAWASAGASARQASCRGPVEPAGCIALDELWHAAEADAGLPSLEAALLLLRAIDQLPPADRNLGAAGIASGVIERAIDEAPARIRIAAIAGAPLAHARLLEAVVDAGKSPDPPVAIAALGRIAKPDSGVTVEERRAAVEALRARAKGLVSRGTEGPAAEQAAQALVDLSDASVLSRLGELAKAKSAASRRRAAEGFADLGRPDQALPLTADEDGAVRSYAACAILRAAD